MKKYNKILLPLMLLSLMGIFFVITLEFSIKKFFPVYDPSGGIYFVKASKNLDLAPKNVTMRQWKNTGDYNVEIKTNELGLRDSKQVTNAMEDDWFVVGDSFSFGWGVEENERYSNQLEKLINKNVYNISIPTNIIGYENLIAYVQQKNVKVKNLILGLCMENDLALYPDKPTEDIYLDPPNPTFMDRFLNFKVFLRDHSSIYNAFTSIIQQNEKLRNLGEKLGLIRNNIEAMNKNKFDEQILASTVNRLKKFAPKYNFIVLIIPARGLWIDHTKEDEQKNHEYMVKKLKEAGVTAIDMKPIIEAGNDPLKYHFKYDGHWNKEAHALAAKELARIIHLQKL